MGRIIEKKRKIALRNLGLACYLTKHSFLLSILDGINGRVKTIVLRYSYGAFVPYQQRSSCLASESEVLPYLFNNTLCKLTPVALLTSSSHSLVSISGLLLAPVFRWFVAGRAAVQLRAAA